MFPIYLVSWNIFIKINSLNYNDKSLLKTISSFFSSLQVKFRGEEAEDAGGVTKEFFLLLLRDILDPKYGMFKVYEETQTIW